MPLLLNRNVNTVSLYSRLALSFLFIVLNIIYIAAKIYRAGVKKSAKYHFSSFDGWDVNSGCDNF
jgi:hypothetical protein